MNKQKSFRMPNAFVIVFIIMIVAAVLTWVIPAGQYDTIEGSKNIDPNTFHLVESHGATPWSFVDAIFTGMQNSAQIILFTILLGGYFNVMVDTKAFDGFITLLTKNSAAMPWW